MNWQRITLIAGFDLQYSLLRAKGLFFLAPFLLFWGLLLYHTDADIIARLKSVEVFTALSAWLGAETARTLLWEHPVMLSAFLLISLMTAPAFMLLAGNNQFSSALSSGYFRFLCTRCRRLEIFIGHYLGSLALAGIALLLIGIYCLGLSASHESYPFSFVFLYFLKIMLIVMLYHAALLSYTAIISAALGSPLGSLLLAAVGYAGLLVFASIANTMHGDTQLFSYVLPGSLKPLLLDMNTLGFMWASLALPVYIMAYGLLAWAIFKQRDF